MDDATTNGAVRPRSEPPVSRVEPPWLSACKDFCLAAYFCTSLLYYYRGAPVGHILNLAFMAVFAAFVLFGRSRLTLTRWQVTVIVLSICTAVSSLVATSARAPFEAVDAVRSLSWLLPAVVVLALSGSKPDFARVGLFSGVVSLVLNLGLTVSLGHFDVNEGKFEVATSFIDVSSNELSFQWAFFGVSMLLLGGASMRHWAVAALITSAAHFSKAHLASLAIALAYVSASGRRVVLIAGLLLVVATGYLAAAHGGLDVLRAMEMPVPAFARLRDMLVLAGGALVDEAISLDAVARAIGGTRFDIYETAMSLASSSPYGYPADMVSSALNGLDPHSNILYLMLRDGWMVLAGYLALAAVLLASIDLKPKGANVLFALAIYGIIRTIFMTFDPVRMITTITVFVLANRAAVQASVVNPARSAANA